MVSKRGAGHIEMILSFVMFTFFVVFLFIYIKPVSNNSIGDSVLIGLGDSFHEKNGVDYGKIFLRVSDFSGSCFSIGLSGHSGNSIVQMVGGSVVGSSYSGSNLVVSSGIGSYYVLISPDFASGSGCSGPSLLSSQNYSIGSIETQKLISNKSLYLLKQSYLDNYAQLKTNYGVPKIIDFTIKSSDGSFDLGGTIPQKVQVFSKEYSENVLYENGSIQNKEFLIQVW